MLKLKKIYSSVLMILAVSFIIGLTVTDSFGQKGGKGRYRKVGLTKDAKKNGYKVTEQGRQQYFLQIFGAENPITKRRLSSEELVEYKCREILKMLEKRILFENGNTGLTRFECSEADLTVKPQILLLDEPD